MNYTGAVKLSSAVENHCHVGPESIVVLFSVVQVRLKSVGVGKKSVGVEGESVGALGSRLVTLGVGDVASLIEVLPPPVNKQQLLWHLYHN